MRENTRENTWREDAQPEWPAAASPDGTQNVPQEQPHQPRLRDPWSVGDSAPDTGTTDDRDGHAPDGHDPDEVTVQLDGLAPEGSDGPVFVDESGRRSRRYRRIGIGVGVACASYAVVIVVTLLSGNSHAPWLPIPGQGDGKEAGRVDSSPLPADSAQPVGTGRVPSAGVSVPARGTTPSPSAKATAPGASASPGKESASATPKPTATATAPGPGGDPTTEPVAPTTPASTPPSEPPATVDPTTPTPTPTSSGDGTGGGVQEVGYGGGTPEPTTAAATEPTTATTTEAPSQGPAV
ncbi:hypothetical protein ACIPSE_44190 [Streptomyces sp. NPDC090106]|uniref:hypothetical protein n=1 Tax=Streptomyces sp. NPDC090106 TaxID=3365946 RepID=UPI0037F15310